MNKVMTKAGLALALGATALTAAAPADAQRYYGRGYHRGGGNAAGAAVLGGLVGLGVGAAIASNRGYGYDRGYGYGYYAPPPPPPVYRGYYGYPGYGYRGFYAPPPPPVVYRGYYGHRGGYGYYGY